MRTHSKSWVFSDAQPGAVSLISPGLEAWCRDLHAADIQIGLNTGYPEVIQEKLIDGLGFANIVDHWISAYQVAKGRPYPYSEYSEATNSITDLVCCVQCFVF